MQERKKETVIILTSGGMDSTACIYYYLSQNFSPKCLFINYGQDAKKMEYDSAKKIAQFYQVTLESIKLDFQKMFSEGEILGRNALFIFAALMKYDFSGIISMGIHAGAPYFDTSKLFLNHINELLNGYSNGKISFDAPFLHWNKRMVYEFCKINNVPINLTYSCERGNVKPCGTCNSCLDVEKLIKC